MTGILIVESNSVERQRLGKLLEGNNELKLVDEENVLPNEVWLDEQKNNHLKLISSSLLLPKSYELLSARTATTTPRNVIAFDIPESPEILRQYNRIGVVGFIGMKAADIEFTTAIRTVIRGGSYFSPNLVDALFRRRKPGSPTGNEYALTGRELEILSLLANGYCNKEIANAFELSVRTVETHRLNIRRKTSANSLSDLVKVARRLDIVHLAEKSKKVPLGIFERRRAVS